MENHGNKLLNQTLDNLVFFLTTMSCQLFHYQLLKKDLFVLTLISINFLRM